MSRGIFAAAWVECAHVVNVSGTTYILRRRQGESKADPPGLSKARGAATTPARITPMGKFREG
jgi:hypothetical protein